MKLPVCTEPVKNVLDAQLAAGGLNITFDELKQKGFIKVPFKYHKYENGGFKTPTGKIELDRRGSSNSAMRRCRITKSRRKAQSARPKLPSDFLWC